MANTYEIIDKTILTGTQASIDFTSIDSSYTDLVLKISTRATDAVGSDGINIRFNGSSTGYSIRRLLGQPSNNDIASDTSTTSGYMSIGLSNSATQTANTFGNLEMYVPNYTSSNFKSVSTDSTPENNTASTYRGIYAGLWSNTAAINQITIYTGGTTFAAGSSFYLYGIKNS
jgi:hypothetical protein